MFCMKRCQRLSTLCMVLFFAALGTGCLIVAPQDQSSGTNCYDNCYEYEVCQSYCDAWSCWDECWWEKDCTQQCTTTTPGHSTPPAQAPQCVSDLDCPLDKYCIDNKCQRLDSSNSGHSGLCQVCDDRTDCGEPDALCIQLNFDQYTRTGEKVCSRACEYNHDCPTGFECINISSEPHIPAQCLPIQGTNEVRTCNPSPELECVRANDCALGESCVNNICVGPENAQCAANRPCPNGQVCRNHQCEAASSPQCLTRSDCGARELCVDGACVPHNQNCIFNEECDSGALCVEGQCTAACTSNSECGPYEQCKDGLCLAAQCRRNADCAVGQLCVDAVCEKACNADEHCAEGFVCSSHSYCVPNPMIECRTTAECERDEICVDGTCEQVCGCNQDCPQSQACDLNTGTCIQLSHVDAEPGQSCNSACDCPSGQKCVNNLCVESDV